MQEPQISWLSSETENIYYNAVRLRFETPAGLSSYLSGAALNVRGRTAEAKVLYGAGTVHVDLEPCPLTHQRFKG